MPWMRDHLPVVEALEGGVDRVHGDLVLGGCSVAGKAVWEAVVQLP